MDQSSKPTLQRGILNPKNVTRLEELDRSLRYHKPTEEQTARIERLREVQQAYARALMDFTFPSREQSEAITCFETHCMWAVKSIVLEPF